MKKFKKLSVMLLCCLLISVIALPVSAGAAKLNKKTLSLNVGKTYTLKASGVKGKIKWTSSKKRIASVSSKGVVKAKKKGNTVITAKYGKKKLTCKVTVKQPVTSIKLNKRSVTLKKGDSLTLKATVSPGSANKKTVTWSSSDKKVATVSSKGLVKAVGKGTATITAKAKDGSKKKAVCKVTVQADASTNKPTDHSTVITTPEQLVDRLCYGTVGKTYTLGNDIDLARLDSDYRHRLKQLSFKGVLDGKGHKILNLDLCLIDTNYGTIKNIIIENMYSNNGLLVDSNHGTIQNITVNSCESERLVRDNYCTVENVNINCNIVAGYENRSWYGVVSYNMQPGTVKGCTVKGKISIRFAMDDVGGIVLSNDFGTIENCNNYADITIKQLDNYELIAAGICALNDGKITNCVNYGSIKGESADVTAFGIAFSGSSFSSELENCLNVGKTDYGLTDHGGVIKHCVDVGASSKGSIRNYNVGRIIDCYYLSSIPGSDAETGQENVQMIPVERNNLTNTAAYPALDFSKDWMMGAQYPIPRQS